MLKTVITLLRGSAARAGKELADRNALLLLDQQIRDASASLEQARRALAMAIAADRQEEQRLSAVAGRIVDLEARVVAALEAGSEAAAREGAEAIAALEADRESVASARALFAAEIGRLKAHVGEAGNRLAALDRGRRTARAAEAVRVLRQGRSEEASLHRATLREAEQTLDRLRQRQGAAAEADDALDAMDRAVHPATVAESLAAQGFGPRLKSTADDVLARLRHR